jgi:ribonuclease M5
MHIQEVIIVEGNHDSALLKSLVDCDTIITHGSTLSKTTQKLIQQAAKERNIIIFTDPDSTGEKIRRQIVKLVPDAKHAFLPQQLALGKGKIGVEHAKGEDIRAALENLLTFNDQPNRITMSDLMELKLAGLPDSEALRNKTAHLYQIGDCNAKTFLRRIGMLNITKEQLTATVEKLWINR